MKKRFFALFLVFVMLFSACSSPPPPQKIGSGSATESFLPPEFETAERADSSDEFCAPGGKIALIGDSITHGYNAYGYWMQLENYLVTRYPDRNIRVLNFGVSGININGTAINYPMELNKYEYDSAILNIGMNDSKTSNITFIARYEQMVKLLLADEKRVAVMTPPAYDEISSSSEPLNSSFSNEGLALRSETIRSTAEKYSLPLIDQYPVFGELHKKLVKETPERSLVRTDRIHPNELGSAVTFVQIIKDLKLPGEVATAAVSAESGKVLYEGNCAVSGVTLAENSLSYEYLAGSLPIAFSDFYIKGNSVVDYNLLINREYVYILDLKPGSYELSVGDKVIGSFTDEELAAGINLAEYATPQREQSKTVTDIILSMAEKQTELREIKYAEYYAKAAGNTTEAAIRIWLINQLKTVTNEARISRYNKYLNNTISVEQREAEIEELWQSAYLAAQPQALTITVAAKTAQ